MTGRRFFGSTIRNVGEILPTPLHAFGFRYGAIGAYSGPLFKIRRSSDNTELDCFSISDATTFVGAGDGFITIWYNHTQSGLATPHLYQTTQSAQPRLIISGVLQTLNSKPAIKFEAGRFLSTQVGIFGKASVTHWVYKTVQLSSFILLSRLADNFSYVATDGSTSTSIDSNYQISGFTKIIKNGLEISIPINRNEVYDQMIGTNVWSDMDVGIGLSVNVGNYNDNASFKFLGEIAEIQIFGDGTTVTGGSFNLADQIAVNNSLKTYFAI